ncbi:MAG: acetylornithine deacetylase [Candidatus Eremiobacterota bacterium]
MTPEGYLRELVAIDSVSSRSNRPVAEYLAARLIPLGFRVDLHPAGPDKVNLVARHGPDRNGGLALVAHTDTVPYDPGWGEALTLTERDGRLYGRGAVDTKAGLACALAAVHALPLDRLKEPLLLVATADEEIGCLGARRLMDEKAVAPAHALVAEPTGLTPVRAHKGYWAAECEVLGQEGHSAYPETGVNAILHAARLLTALEDIAAELQVEQDPDFDPPFCTLNVGTISGGRARNVIPGSCRFPVEWRPLPGQEAQRVADRIEWAIQELSIQVDFRVVRRDPAASTPADAPLVRRLEELTGHASGSIPFGTELPYLNGLGAQSVVFGPGDIRQAHQTGEFVPRDQLERAAEVYREVVSRMAL